MDANEYAIKLLEQLGLLTECARRMNEVDLAASLFLEFRGMQDAGWSTTQTALEVYEELQELGSSSQHYSRATFRHILLLYSQLSETGGIYEGLGNIFRIIQSEPYSGWPFHNLVKVRKSPKRIIGPNANRMFRELSSTAADIGMTKLSDLIAGAFRDDIRNAIVHADYIFGHDGFRMRKRNGGLVEIVSYDDLATAINTGMTFFNSLNIQYEEIAASFNPAREIVGVFSAGPFPCKHLVGVNPDTGAFGISSRSPGPQTTPEYERQVKINNQLGMRIASVFSGPSANRSDDVLRSAEEYGVAPHDIRLSREAMATLIENANKDQSWDQRFEVCDGGDLLVLTPWGFISDNSELDWTNLLPVPEVEIDDPEPDPASPTQPRQ